MDIGPKRHRFHQRVIDVLQVLVAPVVKRIYAFRTEFTEGLDGPFLLLANHVTAVDPVLICTSFRQQMYIVASEHLMQKGFGSRLLRFLFAPIARRKGDTAVTTVKQMLSYLKAGYNVCVFPEGTCSFDGTNPPFLPTIGKVAKAAKVSLVTYRFTGGYFTLPRWGRGIRRGAYAGHTVRIYSPDELKTMSDGEINAHIRADLEENAYARQAQNPVAYRSRRRAELLESAFFLCPQCRRVGTLGRAAMRSAVPAGCAPRLTHITRCTACRFERSPNGTHLKTTGFRTQPKIRISRSRTRASRFGRTTTRTAKRSS